MDSSRIEAVTNLGLPPEVFVVMIAIGQPFTDLIVPKDKYL